MKKTMKKTIKWIVPILLLMMVGCAENNTHMIVVRDDYRVWLTQDHRECATLTRESANLWSAYNYQFGGIRYFDSSYAAIEWIESWCKV